MNKYDVYAIGNALVDSEFQVDLSFFENNMEEKGLMTLIDEEKKKNLWEKAGKDPVKRQCGGSAANSVIAVSQLGGKSFYSYRVSNDETGKFYQNDLSENLVDYDTNNQGDSLPTGTCTVFITPDADRTMYTHLGATTGFGESDLRPKALSESAYLYVEGYLVTSPLATKAALSSISEARKLGKKISLTLSDPGIVAGFKSQFQELMKEPIDLLFCNEEEAMSLTETDNVHSAVESLKNYSHTFAITRGAEGAIVFDGNEKMMIAGFKEKAINTNGAGDMFAGAFLYAINNGMNYKEAGVLGNLLASKVIKVFGPRLTKAECEKYLQEFKSLK